MLLYNISSRASKYLTLLIPCQEHLYNCWNLHALFSLKCGSLRRRNDVINPCFWETAKSTTVLKSRMKTIEKSDNTVTTLFWHEKSSISVANNLLLHGSHIVLPSSLRAETLKHIHEGHQGIVRCQMRMRMSVWWPVKWATWWNGAENAPRMHCPDENLYSAHQIQNIHDKW